MERRSREEYIALQRERVANLARRALEGELDVLVAALQIWRLRGELGLAEDDEDLAVFALIESEIETLPVGDQAKDWHPDAIVRKAPELERTRRWVWDVARENFESLIRRFPAD